MLSIANQKYCAMQANDLRRKFVFAHGNYPRARARDEEVISGAAHEVVISRGKQELSEMSARRQKEMQTAAVLARAQLADIFGD